MPKKKDLKWLNLEAWFPVLTDYMILNKSYSVSFLAYKIKGKAF